MRFYRPPGEIKAITFDLDDTLYDNAIVIRKTIEATHAALQAYHPALSAFSQQDYQLLRDKLRQQEPEIYHDVTEWRRRAIEQAMLNAGLGIEQARNGADSVMAVFTHWRNQVAVPQETHTTLAALAQKFPLVAITNGNADPAQFGLHCWFQFILRAGPDGRAKPWQDMYRLAAQRLNIKAEHILHVGDNLTTDVAGALRCGMQACWINPHETDLIQMVDARLLPHVEISRLASLTALL